MKTKTIFCLTLIFLLLMGSVDTFQAQELIRADGKAWMEDEHFSGHYWEIDTTRVMVEVEASEMPQDIGWELNGDGSISVPVPEGVTIETFVDSLRAFSWVISIGYRRAGSMIGEKYLQTLREGKEWPLVRMGGKVWIEDYVNEGRYWEVDTTRVLVQVYDPSAVPEDITWRFNILNYATVPVPEDMLIEDFMASLRELSWVKLVEYNTYGEYTNEDESVGIGDIHESIPEKVQSSEVDIYDLTGRPLRSRPSKGLYIQKGKKVLVR